GGLAGRNFGGIADSYSLTPIAYDGTQDAQVGGLVASNQGSISRTHAAGRIAIAGATGSLRTGGLVAVNDEGESEGTVAVSFWDRDATGQSASAGGIGLSTADLQDTAGFMRRATGWDFERIWAPGGNGAYPQLYSIDPVLWAAPEALTVTYGRALPAPRGTVRGLGRYVFAPAGDAPAVAGIFRLPAGARNAGTYAITTAASVTSPGGVTYGIVGSAASLTIRRAPLTVDARDVTKLYGLERGFSNDDVTLTGLQYNDALSSVWLTSTGAAAGAWVTGSPHAITASDAAIAGQGGDVSRNYVITYEAGDLTVTPRRITVAAQDSESVYGFTPVLDWRLARGELAGGDVISDVRLTSPGTAFKSPVDRYRIDASDARMAGGAEVNYVITYTPGDLTITPRPITIAAQDSVSRFGLTPILDWGLAAGELAAGDVITDVRLTSDGRAGSPPGRYRIDASDARMTGEAEANYAIVYAPGTLDVLRPVLPRGIPVPLNTVTETGLPNPVDEPSIFPIATPGPGAEISPRESRSLPQAAVPQGGPSRLAALSEEVSAMIEACSQHEGQAEDMLACLSRALNRYSSALDELSAELPPSMQTVSAILRRASADIGVAQSRAVGRLAGAETEAQRRAIRQEALTEARRVMSTARTEIVKQIELLRVEDPELARAHARQEGIILATVEKADATLARAVGL
ncbi:MAG TPA: MBG domain-containing protein, partial [Paracoccus sp. (in: a-proteobacteria)]|nr:MBG domain-containing protein [Paracoccus sp. (in: a-proteobacteria)]